MIDIPLESFPWTSTSMSAKLTLAVDLSWAVLANEPASKDAVKSGSVN